MFLINYLFIYTYIYMIMRVFSAWLVDRSIDRIDWFVTWQIASKEEGPWISCGSTLSKRYAGVLNDVKIVINMNQSMVGKNWSAALDHPKYGKKDHLKQVETIIFVQWIMIPSIALKYFKVENNHSTSRDAHRSINILTISFCQKLWHMFRHVP